ncbi:hypothetical protein LOAG_03515 [Loa loa]|uniref:Uncharacterized protein n=1 Tax=Loa loa TaxID=7209 RepID=A0A1S0U4S0_LOALO|nr:hypothetical protein LOAG_03515 [Loa loa]EFO24970.1 hypothetical protein LOAG_03515 [Loa loa]
MKKENTVQKQHSSIIPVYKSQPKFTCHPHKWHRNTQFHPVLPNQHFVPGLSSEQPTPSSKRGLCKVSHIIYNREFYKTQNIVWQTICKPEFWLDFLDIILYFAFGRKSINDIYALLSIVTDKY